MGALTGIPAILSVIVGTAGFALAQPSDQTANRLPSPTGTFNVGRVTLPCEDPSRIEPLDPNAAPRRIMVDVWYPAELSSSRQAPAAEYLNVAAFEQGLGEEGLRRHLGGSYLAIAAGRLTTHSVQGAPFASSLARSAVLLFSPGGGMIRELYTAQMEDLASHGFVVAAMTHSYDGFLTVLPDGASIQHDGRRWPKIPSVEGEANLNQLEWHTADILAVLNYLTRLNGAASPQFPFAGRMDFKRVGAFGHSFGGVAAAHACQKDLRIKACLNQDGAMGMKPFYLDAQGWGMNQAFMLIERPPNREPLTDQALAAMKMTRTRAVALIAQLNADRDHALRNTGKGSYRVLLRRGVTTHMDFSDLPVLSAPDSLALDRRIQVLALVRGLTLAFFDKHVRGGKAPVLDRSASDQVLESIETFRPAKRP